MERHTLKQRPEYFGPVCAGQKNFEIRKEDDKTYRIGDQVRFAEWGEICGYTGAISRWVTIAYVLRDVPQYGLKPGYCIFGWNN